MASRVEARPHLLGDCMDTLFSYQVENNQRVHGVDHRRHHLSSVVVMTESDTKTVQKPDARTSRGDSDEVAHIVMKDDQMRGYMSGTPIQALCGKVWVPTRNYNGMPVCQNCVEKRDRILSGMKNLN